MKSKRLLRQLFKMVIGLSIVGLNSFAQAQTVNCSDLLSSDVTALDSLSSNLLIKKNISLEIAKFQTWQQRAVIQLMNRSLKSKLTKICEQSSCTEKEIAQAVQQNIVATFNSFEQFKKNMKQIRGYAILTGLSVGIAVSSQFAKGHLPAADQWVYDFITIASSIGLYKLGAPLWDYLGGVMTRGAFRMKDGKSFFRDEAEMALYEENYRLLQEKMTLREQQETLRIANLLNTTESTFSSAIESIQSKDPSKGGIPRAAARIANAAIKLRKFFPEISASDPDLTRTVMMTFTQFLTDEPTKTQLYQKIMEQIQNHDPVAHNKTTAAIYEATIKLWLGLPSSFEIDSYISTYADPI